MSRIFAALLALALLEGWGGLTAQAQQQRKCGDTEALLQLLEMRFDEVPVGVGLAAGGTKIVRLTLSPAGSWTILSEIQRGVSCVMGSGSDWHFAAPKLPGEPT